MVDFFHFIEVIYDFTLVYKTLLLFIGIPVITFTPLIALQKRLNMSRLMIAPNLKSIMYIKKSYETCSFFSNLE